MVKLSTRLVDFSKDLRKKQTPEEKILWSHLRANKFGIKFKRQIVLDKYIFDFGAKRQKLLIELDGAGHKKLKDNDTEKINCATKKGYMVLKFWNSEIDRNLDKVLDKIYQEMN